MPKKIKPYGLTYQRLAARLALDFCPPISPCATCGQPVIQGYCCTFCGDVDPSRPAAPPAEDIPDVGDNDAYWTGGRVGPVLPREG
jgi:hypothetical protein